MKIALVIANEAQHAQHIRELFSEYLQWGNANVRELYGVSFDIAATIEADMKDLGKFMPPNGRLLVCYVGDDLAGIACLKQLAPGIGEIKRMYVRPANQGKGLGHALLDRLLQEAYHIGYRLIRLDSARFMTAAHQLYRAAGFKEIQAYEGSEIPKEFQKHWVFMERPMSASKNDKEKSTG